MPTTNRRIPLEDRFWARVDRRGIGDCWPWLGARSPYGYIRVGGRNSQRGGAHRIAWMLAHGPIPHGLAVLHKCDHPWCTNPHHLFLGTWSDNAHDRDAKGRGRYGRSCGSCNGRAKLSEPDIPVIFTLAGNGWTQIRIAHNFGVSQPAISAVLRGQSWQHDEEKVNADD